MPGRNAATPTKAKPFALGAAAGIVTKKDLSTTMGGLANFDTNNRWRYYQQLDGATPHASISLDKLSLSLIKGMQFQGSSSRNVKEFETWAKKTNFFSQMSSTSRLLCRDCTYVGLVTGATPETIKLQPFLMPYTTLLPDGETPGQSKQRDEADVLQPPVTQFVVNEGNSTFQKVFSADQVVYAAYKEYACEQEDILERMTWGIYGDPLINTVELSIRNLLNINYGYVSFVHKYGNGRYHFDFKLLEDLVKQGVVDYDTAQAAIDVWMEKNKNLSENEDICSYGMDIVPIDTKGSLNVLEYKKSLETDIQIGLLQSPLSMGDSKGSTYAAGYISEADRMVVLEGLQNIIKNVANDFVNKRLTLLKKPFDSVEVVFEELSIPELTPEVLLEMANTGKITDEEFRRRTGFPPKKSESVN